MKNFVTCLMLSIMSWPLFGQWESMEGPQGGDVSSIYENSSFYFIKTSNGIYRSVTGNDWEQLKLDIPKLYRIDLIAVTDSFLYVSLRSYFHQTDSSLLFRSGDHGETWLQLSPPNLYSARNLYVFNEMVL